MFFTSTLPLTWYIQTVRDRSAMVLDYGREERQGSIGNLLDTAMRSIIRCDERDWAGMEGDLIWCDWLG